MHAETSVDPVNQSFPAQMFKSNGQKRHFSPRQIQTLARYLEDKKQHRKLALLCLSIDSMLRSVDILRLLVRDVVDQHGVVLDGFVWKQLKTNKSVEVALLEYTRTAINCWISSAKLKPDDFLFPGKTGATKPLTSGQFRRIVKGWAESLELNPDRYASHSLRRSKPAFMFADHVQPAYLRFLLGHSSLASTQEYLGADRQTALDLVRQYDMFNHETNLCLSPSK